MLAGAAGRRMEVGVEEAMRGYQVLIPGDCQD
jgi:hypothetical protein